MTMTSIHGCSVIETGNYWFFLKKLMYLFAFIGMAVGLVTCLAGRLFMKYVIFITVVCATIALSVATVFLIGDGHELGTFAYWLTFVIASVCGLLLAWVSTKYETAGMVILAGWTGFEIGAVLSNLIYFQLESKVIFWLIIGVSSLVVLLIAITNVNHHMIWVSAIFGAYLFIISFSLFYGRYPIDLNLPELQSIGAIVTTEPNFFLYMGVWLVCSTIGVAFQCMTLLYFKNRGKQLKPGLQEAVDNFRYGRTAEQIKRDKDRQKFQRYCDRAIDERSESHDSIYLDLESRHRTDSMVMSLHLRNSNEFGSSPVRDSKLLQPKRDSSHSGRASSYGSKSGRGNTLSMKSSERNDHY